MADTVRTVRMTNTQLGVDGISKHFDQTVSRPSKASLVELTVCSISDVGILRCQIILGTRH